MTQQIPQAGDLWTYRANGNRYLIRHLGKSKQAAGAWEDSVTYTSMNGEVDHFFTRDVKTFLEKFSLFLRPKEQV
jgi:hypothetical protein